MNIMDLQTLIRYGVENEIVDCNFKRVIQDNIHDRIVSGIAESMWGESVNQYLDWNIIDGTTVRFQPCMGLIVFRIDGDHSNIHIQYDIKKHQIKLCDTNVVPHTIMLEVQMIMTSITNIVLNLEV